MVLRGVGDTFTAGYDLTQNDEPFDQPYGAPDIETCDGAWDPVRDYGFMGNNVRRFISIWECPKPVLLEVKGWAIGSATDLVLCCDLLYMASDDHIGYVPSRIYGTPATMLWVYRPGPGTCKTVPVDRESHDAATAYRIGLVSQAVEPDQLADAIESEARRFASIPANQLALNKMLINQAFENMGLRTTQLLGTLFDGMTRYTEEAKQWVEPFADKGFREVIREQDKPWQDYGEKPQEDD